MAAAIDSKSIISDDVRVRVPPRAPSFEQKHRLENNGVEVENNKVDLSKYLYKN